MAADANLASAPSALEQDRRRTIISEATARGHPLAVERYLDPISVVRGKTIHHSSELGRWEMVLGDPAPGLCPHVRSYWGYAEETDAFSRRRELATAHAVLIVGFGPPIEVSFPRLGERVRATAFVSGLSDC